MVPTSSLSQSRIPEQAQNGFFEALPDPVVTNILHHVHEKATLASLIHVSRRFYTLTKALLPLENISQAVMKTFREAQTQRQSPTRSLLDPRSPLLPSTRLARLSPIVHTTHTLASELQALPLQREQSPIQMTSPIDDITRILQQTKISPIAKLDQIQKIVTASRPSMSDPLQEMNDILSSADLSPTSQLMALKEIATDPIVRLEEMSPSAFDHYFTRFKCRPNGTLTFSFTPIDLAPTSDVATDTEDLPEEEERASESPKKPFTGCQTKEDYDREFPPLRK